MKKRIDFKMVIGANYGDEGKGQTANYLTLNNKGIIILNNGGAQRGHTVTTKDGKSHVFHHFGSTFNEKFIHYCSQFFIVNPAIWSTELNELQTKFNYSPELYIHPNCLVSTPFDMLLNQMIELNRGNNKHGSVGVGIWETIKRNNIIPLMFFDKSYLTTDFKTNIIKYFKSSIITNNISKDIQNKFLNDLDLDKLYGAWSLDFLNMQHTCLCTDINTKYNENDSIIIENGQGLLLNGNSNDVHTTPSNTTSENLNAIMNLFNRNINSTNTNIELCYVTRTYLTRHGRGDLSGEVSDKSNISEYIETDSTNVFNPYQENIRYAPLNTKQLLKNISNDYKRFKNIPVTKTIFLTHINEIGYNYMNILDEFKAVDEIDNIYISADKYSENILKI